ncbi:MAG: FapA family protein [Syntrophomonadaceae bacterium]|nr:FapA family protein [Syntrophomonadaceae bacterium]
MRHKSKNKFKVSKKADGVYLRIDSANINSHEIINYLYQLNIIPSQELLGRILNSRPGSEIFLDQVAPTDDQLYNLNLILDDSVGLNIVMSPDRMQAHLTITSQTNSNISEQYILNQLQKVGICFGVNKQAVKEAVLNPGKQVEVARGRYAIDGRDAHIDYLYQKPEIKPVLCEDGTVDYYDLGYIVPIQAGDIIARRQSAVPGQPGMDVTGQVIPARDGRNFRFKVGKGVIVNNDYALAEIEGALSWSNDTIQVTRVLIIPGDVDFSVGNISFMGKVLVQGNIKEGFLVEADEDIEVRGGIDNARVVSRRGSITVHKGVIGSKTCLTASKNIAAKFAQEATLEAGQNVYINEYILRCQIKAGDSVLLQGRRGIVLGNNSVLARAKIKVANIQNCKSLDLRVEGINRHLYYKQVRDLNSRIVKLEDSMGVLSDVIRTYRTNLDDPHTLVKLQQYLPEYIHLTEEYNQLVEQRSSIVAILRSTRGDGMIEIGGGLEAGMLFTIKNEPVVLKERLRNIRMYYDTDEKKIITITDKS